MPSKIHQRFIETYNKEKESICGQIGQVGAELQKNSSETTETTD